jgi:hypothetical protein
MSHFTTLVAFRPADTAQINDEDILPRLLPFHEYGCGSDYGDRELPNLQFEDKTEEYQQQWQTDTCNMVRLANGGVCSRHDGCFQVVTDPERSWHREFQLPEGAEEFEMPLKERYPTFVEFCEDWHGTKPNSLGRYGYWHNPNAKWDWFQVGGRWKGLLSLKDGSSSNLAPAGTVDWQAMYDTYIEKELTDWSRWQECWQEATAAPLTEEELEEAATDFTPDTNEYQKAVAQTAEEYGYIGRAKHLMQTKFDHYMIGLDDIAGWQVDRVAFLHNHAFEGLTWAFVDLEGRWHEKGEMGWWGMSSNEQPVSYGQAWWEFVNNLSPDVWVAVCDCHI